MTEINARIGLNDSVELADENGRIIGPSPQALTPDAAVHLAKELLGCAVSLLSPSKPKPGTMPGYSEFPVQNWGTMTSPHTGELLLILLMPSGIELPFAITTAHAQAMGDALAFAAKSRQATVAQSGSVH